MKRILASILPLLCLCACAAARPAFPTSDQCTLVKEGEGYGPPGTVVVAVDTVTSGLEVPWSIAFLPDGDLLVTERAGRLRRVHRGALVPEPILDLDVAARGEGGLMGLALHPDFAQNRLFYIYYTRREGLRHKNRVERYRLSESGTEASRDRVIFEGIAAAMYHDGGRLHIGPDRMLYIGTGDARSPDSAQARDKPNGKLLRLTLDGAVPPDNPWPGLPAYLLGVRNLQAFDWIDPHTLVLAIHGPSGEFGRQGHDTVTVAHAGDNLGWPTIYGCEAAPGMVSPALSWEEAVPPGGAVYYRGDAIPEWRGSLLVGTLKSAHLHRVVLDGARTSSHEVYFLNQYGRLREVAVGPDGAVYVTTSNCDGRSRCPPEKDRILRIHK